MKKVTLAFQYSGDAETWDDIREDAENDKIKNVFVGKKEFVNVVRCEDCKNWLLDTKEYITDCNSSGYFTSTCNCKLNSGRWYEKDFCSNGKRREE